MVQTSSSILVLRFSRTQNADGKHYISTTAVVMSEIFKVGAAASIPGQEAHTTSF